MANANPKIVLSPSQDIPFNKLVLSQANVRRVKTGVSIEELAEDIARPGRFREHCGISWQGPKSLSLDRPGRFRGQDDYVFSRNDQRSMWS
jgi:hypothetical protein